MKTGAIISGAAHLLFLLLAFSGLPWVKPKPAEEVAVTQVSLMTNAEFEAEMSSTPSVIEEIVPAEVSEADNPMTAEPEEVQPSEPVIAVNSDNTTVDGTGGDGNSVADEPTTSDEALLVPRIAEVAVAPTPEDTQEGDTVVEETAPEETASEPVIEEEPQSQPAAVTEIIPEAQPDATPTASPVIASMPVLRAPDGPSTASEIDLAVQAAEEDAIRDLLAEALNEEAPAETPNQPDTPAPVSLTGSQKRNIGAAVSQHWNKSIVLGKANYEQLVVRVSVMVAADGRIISDVTPVEPSNPTGDFQVAFDAARRAVMRADVIPLPAGQFPDGVKLILRFDPVLGIGLN